MIVLGADIGGTSTRLQLARVEHQGLVEVRQQVFASGAYASLEAVLDEFLAGAGRLPAGIDAACLGVAGPVEALSPDGQQAQITNLPWRLSSTALADRYRIPRVRLINDFQAIGYGIEVLAPQQLLTLQVGTPLARAPRLLLGAGTGLGQSLLVWQGDAGSGRYEPLPSEGGHADFAPADEEQRALLAFLAARLPRVRSEDVLSGPGLVNLYRFLSRATPDDIPAALKQALATAEGPAAITRLGLAGEDTLAGQTLDLFVRIYGSQAGNLALTGLARGGVYIAGGIAPRLRERLQQGAFITAFRDKPPMTAVLASIPVHLVLEPLAGLLGATHLAARR